MPYGMGIFPKGTLQRFYGWNKNNLIDAPELIAQVASRKFLYETGIITNRYIECIQNLHNIALPYIAWC